MHTIRLANHWPEWSSRSGEMVVANLCLAERPHSEDAYSSVQHQIRALVTDAEPIKTLLRSIEEGNARISIIPQLTRRPDNTLSIDVTFKVDAADVDGADDFRHLWNGIIRRAAEDLVKDLRVGIEHEIRQF